MCFPNCAKYLLVVLNIAIFLAGATTFAAGLLLLLETGLLNNDVITLLDYIQYGSVKVGLLLQVICYMMIVSGGIIMMIAVVGICGAWKKIRCCLLLFVFFVVIIILIQGTLIGLWINLSGRSDQWLQGEMTTLLKIYHGPTSTDHVSNGYNKLFTKARCCGVSSHTDMKDLPTSWYTVNVAAGNTEKIPATCCQGVDTDDDIASSVSSTCTETPQDYYTDGCYNVIKDKVDSYLLIMSLVCGIGLFLEITVIVLTCTVLDQTKNRIRSGLAGEGQARPPPYIGIDAVLKNKRNVKRI